MSKTEKPIIIGAEENGILKGVLYHLSKEFSKLIFINTDSSVIVENSEFLQTDGILQTEDKTNVNHFSYIIIGRKYDEKLMYELIAYSKQLDLPKTYTIVNEVRKIKDLYKGE